MKQLLRIIVVTFALSAVIAAATPVRSAGSKDFDEARISLMSGEIDNAVAATEAGWAAVLAGGPTAPGFLEGVFDASGVFAALGRALRAETVYSEAEMRCAAAELQLVKLRLQYMHADHLIRNSEYAKAEAILRAPLAADNRAAQKSSLYVAILQSLAFVREQQGDLDDAEAFYRMAIGYPPPDLSGVVIPTFRFGKQLLPFVGEPRSAMAAFYGNHGRIREAGDLYRELVASLNGEERISAMRQLVDFLRAHGSKTEALTVQEQITELRKKEPVGELTMRPSSICPLQAHGSRLLARWRAISVNIGVSLPTF